VEAAVTVPLSVAVFAVCAAMLAGVGLAVICLSILVASRAHVCPAPEPDRYDREPAYADEPGPYEPEPVAPAADEELAELHARQRQWHYPEPAQQAPAAPVPLLLYDAAWNTVLGATGSFSVADLEAFMASEEAKAVAHGFRTNGKRKRSKAGAR
jgi:hypothetical protein